MPKPNLEGYMAFHDFINHVQLHIRSLGSFAITRPLFADTTGTNNLC